MKRSILILTTALALTLADVGPGMADAQTVRDRVVAELQQDGYTEIRISRTLLGRMRIIATQSGMRREIVLNPSTGVILRDFIRFFDDTPDRDEDDDEENSVTGNGGSGQSFADDDDDDGNDDDHAEDDDDRDDDDEDDRDDDDDDDRDEDDDDADDDDDSDDSSDDG